MQIHNVSIYNINKYMRYPLGSFLWPFKNETDKLKLVVKFEMQQNLRKVKVKQVFAASLFFYIFLISVKFLNT